MIINVCVFNVISYLFKCSLKTFFLKLNFRLQLQPSSESLGSVLILYMHDYSVKRGLISHLKRYYVINVL